MEGVNSAGGERVCAGWELAHHHTVSHPPLTNTDAFFAEDERVLQEEEFTPRSNSQQAVDATA